MTLNDDLTKYIYVLILCSFDGTTECQSGRNLKKKHKSECLVLGNKKNYSLTTCCYTVLIWSIRWNN
jgi:hypothetical protein